MSDCRSYWAPRGASAVVDFKMVWRTRVLGIPISFLRQCNLKDAIHGFSPPNPFGPLTISFARPKETVSQRKGRPALRLTHWKSTNFRRHDARPCLDVTWFSSLKITGNLLNAFHWRYRRGKQVVVLTWYLFLKSCPVRKCEAWNLPTSNQITTYPETIKML